MKKSTATAKPIKFDRQSALRRRQLIADIESLPDVTRVGDCDDMAVEFSVDAHMPLDRFYFTNSCENRFWTRHYNPVFEARTETAEQFEISLKNGAFSGNAPALCRALNENGLLSRLLSQTDLLSLTLTAGEGVCRIRVSPMVGCIIKMLFPGMTYFIRPQHKELAQCLQILQLLLSVLQL